MRTIIKLEYKGKLPELGVEAGDICHQHRKLVRV